MATKRKKISELPLAASLVGLFTIGVDAANKSVKISLEWLKTASDNVLSAITKAETAADKANTAAAEIRTDMNAIEQEWESEKTDINDIKTDWSNNLKPDLEDAIESATAAATSADSKATLANTAANTANIAAESANTAKEGVLTAIENANDTANHPNIIGEDLYWYKWDKATKKYVKTEFYSKGAPGAGNVDIVNSGTLKKDVPYLLTPTANGAQTYNATDPFVGGRNLVTGSYEGFVKYGSAGEVTILDGINTKVFRIDFTDGATGPVGIMSNASNQKMKLTKGKEYTLSFLARGNVGDITYVYIMNKPAPNSGIPGVSLDKKHSINESEFSKCYFKFRGDDTMDASTGSYVMIATAGKGTTDMWFEVKDIKLTEGLIITDWSPAPEDILPNVRSVIPSNDNKDKYRSVIALCKLDNTNTQAQSVCCGTIFLHRTNGTLPPLVIKTGFQKRYNTESFWYNLQYNFATTDIIRACTFTYKGVKYGGIEYYRANYNARVDFDGIKYGIEPFHLFYQSIDDSNVGEEEVINSIEFNVGSPSSYNYINDKLIATTDLLDAKATIGSRIKIANAVDMNEAVSLSQMEQRFEGSQVIVDNLPAIGTAGVFYLVPVTGETNSYTKHIWVLKSGVWSWQSIGTTTIDLTDYAKKTDVATVLESKADKSKLKATTLQSGSWVDDMGLSGFFTYNITDADITGNVVKTEFFPASEADAEKMEDAGIRLLGEETAGGFIIKSESLPAENINIKYLIMS